MLDALNRKENNIFLKKTFTLTQVNDDDDDDDDKYNNDNIKNNTVINFYYSINSNKST